MSSVKSLLDIHGISPKKKWGQNFLTHPQVAEKIVGFANIPPGSRVLEIGPGLGAMTEVLLRTYDEVVCIEKDPKLYLFLKERFADHGNFRLHHADILTWDPGTLPSHEEYHVCANLPYSISTPVIEFLITHLPRWREITLLLQKELVDRIVSGPGMKSYGSLSVFVQTVCEAEAGPVISKHSFHPVPDVSSRLVKLLKRESMQVASENLQAFFDLTRRLFQFRRKTIKTSLQHILKPTPEAALKSALDGAGGDRVEDLSIQDLYSLYRSLSDNKLLS